ncbi:MAG TPA: hypothetical protein VGI15_05645 [Candidatus Cybelea sp.]
MKAPAAVLLLVVAACAPHVPYQLSQADQARFGSRVLRVAQTNRDPMIFGLNDCMLYKAHAAHADIVGWDVVLASDWGMSSYPKWATACTSQQMKYDGKYIVVSFCAQAIGAGGGCAGGDGTYRSRTGNAQGWQIRSSSGWVALPKY